MRGRFDAVDARVYDVSLLKKEDTPGKIKARQRQPIHPIFLPAFSLLLLSLFPLAASSVWERDDAPYVEGEKQGRNSSGASYH